MSSLGPADIYIDVPIETDPQDVLDDAYTYLSNAISGWEPAAGNLDVWLLMAMASIAAESRDVASLIPASIFRWFGANLINLPPIEEAPASVLTTWVAVDNNGYTIPAGTQVAIPVVGGDPIPFITVTDTVIAPGTTTVANVVIEAVDPGVAGNGLGSVGGTVQLLDALIFVSTVTQAAVTAGGVDAELDTDYLNRLTAELQLLSPTPILPNDFAVYARNTQGVYRATAIDLYNVQHNLITANDASLETSVGNWINSANATVTQDATFGVDGTKSLKLASVAAGNMAAVLSNTGQVAVVPGETYTGLATVKPASARTCLVGLAWYTSGGAFISTSYNNGGSGVAVGAGATVAMSVTAAAPATAAFVRLMCQVQSTGGAGEVANFDKMSVRHGVTTDWVAGGTAETNQPRTVTVSALDQNGVPVSSTIRNNMIANLQAQREVNFVIYAMDAVTTLIDVTVSIKALATWDTALVQQSVTDAINAFLNPATWGNFSGQNPQDWANTTVVRYLQLAQIIGDAPGVGYIASLTFGLHGGALASADYTLPGQFPLPDASTISVTFV